MVRLINRLDMTIAVCWDVKPQAKPTKVHELFIKVRKKAKIRNLYNQVPHLTKDTVLESDKSTRKRHLEESQENMPFPNR